LRKVTFALGWVLLIFMLRIFFAQKKKCRILQPSYPVLDVPLDIAVPRALSVNKHTFS